LDELVIWLFVDLGISQSLDFLINKSTIHQINKSTTRHLNILLTNSFASYDRMGFVRAARVMRRRFFLLGYVKKLPLFTASIQV